MTVRTRLVERLVCSRDIHVRREALTRSYRHPNRLARGVFRLGVAVCVLIVVVSVVSCWRSVFVVIPGCFVSVDSGSVYSVFVGGGQTISKMGMAPAVTPFSVWPTAIKGKREDASVAMCSLPTWMFLLAALIPTFLAWRRLCRPLPGHCQQCGYNLTGNVTGVCSECGEDLI